MTFVYDAAEDTSELLILAADDFSGDPVARIGLPPGAVRLPRRLVLDGLALAIREFSHRERSYAPVGDRRRRPGGALPAPIDHRGPRRGGGRCRPVAQLLRARMRRKMAESDRYRWIVLGVALLGFLTVTFTITILAVSIPTIAEDLGTSENALTWLITGPTLAFGDRPAGRQAGRPPGAPPRLPDRPHRRRGLRRLERAGGVAPRSSRSGSSGRRSAPPPGRHRWPSSTAPSVPKSALKRWATGRW